MAYCFPEQPLLIYPSLAERFGLEEALLLGICHQLAQQIGLRDSRGLPELQLDQANWLRLVSFWEPGKLNTVTNSLACQGALEATRSGTAVRIVLLTENVQPDAAPVPPVPVEAPRAQETVSRLSVFDEPPVQPGRAPLGVVRSQPPARHEPRTPAPAFGGSTGWRKHKSELQLLFEQHEERNQKLHAIFLGWQPSDNFFALLPRHGIPESFARECLDEFVLYWLDKDRKETNWDQKFLGWVKREWVHKQSRDGREQRQAKQPTGFNHEDSRRDSREKRKRVTQAIMDIKDTDW